MLVIVVDIKISKTIISFLIFFFYIYIIFFVIAIKTSITTYIFLDFAKNINTGSQSRVFLYLLLTILFLVFFLVFLLNSLSLFS